MLGLTWVSCGLWCRIVNEYQILCIVEVGCDFNIAGGTWFTELFTNSKAHDAH